MPFYYHDRPFALESGSVLPNLRIGYTLYGQLEKRRHIIWVCHALTANADVAEWWPGLFGKGRLFDPSESVIVCANMLGSSYGSSSPADVRPDTGKPYGRDWPLITIRDMVEAHRLLAEHLGIAEIDMIIGGSMGGQQALEWSIIEPDRIKHMVLLATSARHSAWGIAWNEAQRMAMTADPTFWNSNLPDFGKKGIEAARAVAMLSYRSYDSYVAAQTDNDLDLTENFRASSYQQYQGLKLSRRFHPWSYWSLSRSMDSHNVGRHRESIESALARVRARTLVIGFTTDVLFPVSEQRFLTGHIAGAVYKELEAPFGHDGFLVETDQIETAVRSWLECGAQAQFEAASCS